MLKMTAIVAFLVAACGPIAPEPCPVLLDISSAHLRAYGEHTGVSMAVGMTAAAPVESVIVWVHLGNATVGRSIDGLDLQPGVRWATKVGVGSGDGDMPTGRAWWESLGVVEIELSHADADDVLAGACSRVVSEIDWSMYLR
jgi:hypothetical protein